MSLWRSSSSADKNRRSDSTNPSHAAGQQGSSELEERYFTLAKERLMAEIDRDARRSDVLTTVKLFVREKLGEDRINLNVLDQRNLTTAVASRIWNEIELLLQDVPPDVPVHQNATDLPPETTTPSVTQIIEEGVTVFGMDAEAPVEVKAQFEIPESIPLQETTISEEDEFLEEPVVPLASDSLEAAEQKPEPEPEENSNAFKLEPVTEGYTPRAATQIEVTKEKVQPLLLERIDISAAVSMDRLDLARDISDIVGDILMEERIQLNQREQRELIERLMHDMLGLGPLEPLLADEAVTDIMVNGAKQVYVEKKGKLVLSECQFRDDAHVMSIASRIVSHVGRRVDESNPLVDARLADGSRVNIIIPPLAIDGPSISIRKFAKQKITLDVMERQGNLSPSAATVLRVAGRCRLNILISGGTGSGKTTMLNAISQLIDPGERIVTIEDAAELQMQQPHVVRLETRSANLEGGGEITMRDLLKNSLRMRPDRIILGEIRGGEAIDMLQAMNTGHDGSLSTIHANRPREALTRLENMVGMSGVNLPAKAVRQQISSAIDLIIQVSRMRDGVRRITYISEVVGMEEEVITMQDLFWYEYKGEDKGGRLLGDFKSSGLRPHFTPRAAYFGLDKMLLGAM
nr:CpaF family protein [Sneathiella sp. P13V-1]